MKRFLSNSVMLGSLLVAVATTLSWVLTARHATSYDFLRHGQKWRFALAGWQLRFDNEPQRQMESDAPRKEAYLLLDRLDEIYDRQRIFLGMQPWSDRDTESDLDKTYVEERNRLARLAALGYVPQIGFSLHAWGGSRVARLNGQPVFARAPASLPAPTTKLASIFLPLPILLALALALPLRAFGHWLCAVRRDLRRQCAKCGYDLRASKERCPECGAEVPANSAWMHRLLAVRNTAREARAAVIRAWALPTPRRDNLRERWIFYVFAWFAIAEFPIILWDALCEICHFHFDWRRVGASLGLMVLDLFIAAGSVWLTRIHGTAAPASE